jgi:hypothetical protein
MNRAYSKRPTAASVAAAIFYLALAARAAAGDEPPATTKAPTQGGPTELREAARREPAEPRVARLIQQLGSEQYRERDTASGELAKFGTTVRRQLEAAATSSDPEVRLRAGELLMQVRTLDLWSPSVVDVQVQQAPLSRVVGRLVEQSSNHVRIGDLNGRFNERPVSLNFPAGTFWEVLDEACRQSHNRVRCHYDTREPGFLLMAGLPNGAPTAYSGPMRAQITRLVRTFSDRVDFGDDGPQRVHAFDLDVQMVWEDRFRLVGFRTNPVIVEAVIPGGETLTPVQGVAGNWQAASASTKQLSARLGLSPPPVAARKLERLTLRWSLMAIGEMKQLSIDGPAESRKASRDDVELTIDSLDRRDRDRCEVACVVMRDMVLPEPAEIAFQEYRLDLQDEEGRVWRNQNPSFLLTDRGVQIRTTFVRDGTQGEPNALVLHYPGLRSQRDLEFAFTDVPVPHARPE